MSRLYAAFHERLRNAKEDEKKKSPRTWEIQVPVEEVTREYCPGCFGSEDRTAEPPVFWIFYSGTY